MILYSNIIPPEFAIDTVGPEEVLLHYRSKRDGLTPFVSGLISGISKMFSHPITVEVREEKAKGADHDVFYIKY